MMAATDEATRTRRAHLTQLRQELLAPVSAILGYEEMVSEEARRLHLDHLGPDLAKIRDAARRLFALVDRLVEMGTSLAEDPGRSLPEVESELRHDLRTPLNAINGYTELLLEDLTEPETEVLRDDLRHLLGESAQLLHAIDRIVLASRGEAEGGEDDLARQLARDLIRSVRSVTGEPLSQPESGRVLVVDDNTSNRDVLCRRLERYGWPAVPAASGAAALELLERETFDVILLDLIMPEMNGYELLRRLKAETRTRHIPVIMVSGLSDADSAIRCIEAGAVDYLEKPVNPVLLRARVGVSLERKRARDREQLYLAELTAEKARSEALLHNVLPRSIVARLNSRAEVIADRFDDVTILFCDLVGFTQYAAELPAGELVEHLNRVFSAFDHLCHRLGVEKIKTIGDAYMAACGLPEPRADHAHTMAELALGMLEAVRCHNAATGAAFQVRIGIHCGPVVAGVIGSHKFIYDVWGETVNLASRLEAHGLPDQIQVSSMLHDVLGGHYRFTTRGLVELRGVGRRPVHLLVGRTAES
jgi:class 3 adenylate cyclase